MNPPLLHPASRPENPEATELRAHDTEVAPFGELAPLTPLGGARVIEEQPRPWSARLWGVGEQLVPVLGLALLAGLTWWLVRNAPQPEAPPPDRSRSRAPDVEMQDFALHQFGTDGRQVAILRGTQAFHYPADRSVLIQHPVMRWHDLKGIEYEAQAIEAQTDDTTTQVELRGNATVIRYAPDALATFSGQAFGVDTRTHTLDSSKPVELVQGGITVNAATLHFTRDSGVAELTGVRGRLVPAAR